MTEYKILSDDELKRLNSDAIRPSDVISLIATAVAERRGRKEFEEVIDNIRQALGQDATHYLIIADDIGVLVKAVEETPDSPAMKVLTKLRLQGKQ